MNVRDYFAVIDAAEERVRQVHTVDEVIEILREIEPPSSGDAFWGGDGDDLLAALYEAGFRSHRYQAPYYWVLKDRFGTCISYTEGDVSKGDNTCCAEAE